jgi:hypothetical protein
LGVRCNQIKYFYPSLLCEPKLIKVFWNISFILLQFGGDVQKTIVVKVYGELWQNSIKCLLHMLDFLSITVRMRDIQQQAYTHPADAGGKESVYDRLRSFVIGPVLMGSTPLSIFL